MIGVGIVGALIMCVCCVLVWGCWQCCCRYKKKALPGKPLSKSKLVYGSGDNGYGGGEIDIDEVDAPQVMGGVTEYNF